MSDAQYFVEEPTVASAPTRIELALSDGTFMLTGDRGVFARDHIDSGTRILLQAELAFPPPTGNLLDLGCGYGPIAATLARRAPEAIVWAVDINSRAVGLTRSNAVCLGLDNVRACSPAEVPTELSFDGIWSNPPIRIGKQALHEMLLMWLDRLKAGGSAWLVVQRHLGADSLAEWLAEQGFEVSRRSSKQGYRILEAKATRPHGGSAS